MPKTVGIILAGGSGSRFGSSTPKQFIKLAGKLVIEHTVDVFQKSPQIDEIVVVSSQDYVDLVWELAGQNQWTKVNKVVLGGEQRFDSTLSAINSLDSCAADTRVLFHDAARPLVTNEIIERCVRALDVFDAVDVVIPTSDTLVQVSDNSCIANIPVRTTMRRGQTPQAFKLGTIRAAYKNALRVEQRNFTCDCGVVRAMLPGETVITVDGSEYNLKITTPMDLFLAEKLIQTSSIKFIDEDIEMAVLRDKVVVIVGGSYGIGKAITDLCRQHSAIVHSASRSSGNVNVTKKESLSNFFRQIHNQTGRIDYVVNTAGILIKKPLTTMTTDEINTIVDVNLTGTINVAHCAKEYLHQSKGSLLNFTSSSYTRGRAFYAAYSATKAGIVNLTQALSDEWHADSIRINCINPERTDTPMRRSNFGIEPPGSLLSPMAVARMSILALISDHTGLIFDVKNHMTV